MMNSSVIVDDLIVRRGKADVLKSVSLTVPRGCLLGVLGPSGSGKTTLLRSIVGVQIVRSGTVTVLGKPAGHRTLRDRIGYVTQSASVYDDLTVSQNLEYFRAVVGAPRTEVDRVIGVTDLGKQAKRLVGTLSGGQRGRVSLAAALIGGPELVILDEPTVGLDPVLRSELWATFHGLAADGTTVIVSSHVMDEAMRCDRLLLLREGRVLADTTPTELLRSTGSTDPEQAFLEIVRRAASDEVAA